MKVYTTGQAAKVLKVSPRTVTNWCDSGRLKSYRIPGSHSRRIPHEYLVRFCAEYGMSIETSEGEQPR